LLSRKIHAVSAGIRLVISSQDTRLNRWIYAT
jgi:hypothetical protein